MWNSTRYHYSISVCLGLIWFFVPLLWWLNQIESYVAFFLCVCISFNIFLYMYIKHKKKKWSKTKMWSMEFMTFWWHTKSRKIARERLYLYLNSTFILLLLLFFLLFPNQLLSRNTISTTHSKAATTSTTATTTKK